MSIDTCYTLAFMSWAVAAYCILCAAIAAVSDADLDIPMPRVIIQSRKLARAWRWLYLVLCYRSASIQREKFKPAWVVATGNATLGTTGIATSNPQLDIGRVAISWHDIAYIAGYSYRNRSVPYERILQYKVWVPDTSVRGNFVRTRDFDEVGPFFPVDKTLLVL